MVGDVAAYLCCACE